MGALYFGMPWFLLGMLTLILPFLLLLTKAKTRRITNFSTTLFLRSITEKASNVIQWKRLLLLFSRLLLLFSLAAAFALPFLNRRGGIFLGKVQSHLVFVLDNSYSMGYRENDTRLFEIAKAKIEELAKKNKKGRTWFSLYTFNTELEPQIVKVTEINKLMAQLKDAFLSSEGTSYADLLAQLKEKVPVEPEIPTKLFILSDFSVREAQLRNDLENLMKSWCSSCSTQLLALQPKVYRNFSLQSVVLPPHFFVPNVEEEIRVGYQAFGMVGEEVSVSLWVDEAEVAKQKIVISEAEKGAIIFRQKFPAAGSFKVRIQAGKDGLEADNTRYALIQVHEPLRVLLVDTQVYQYPFENPYYYFSQVLESGRSEEARSWIDIAQTPLSDLANFKLSQYHLTVMADISAVDSKQATQLKYYLKEGGSLLFALGKNFEGRKDLNSNTLTQFLGGAFGEMVQSQDAEKPIRFSSVQYQHPLFQVFDYGKRGDFNSVQFFKMIPFIPQEKTAFEVLLWLQSKQPALIEMKKDKGLLFLWTSSLNQEWTDFPKQPLFVPFVFELVKYMALRSQVMTPHLKVGERLIFDAQGMDLAKPITLKNPKDEQLTLYRDKENTASVEADFPGFYEWMDYTPDGIEKRVAVVNVVPEEARPAYVKIEESKIPETVKAVRATGGLATRFYIYRSFLYTAFAMLFLEAWLANRFYKPKII